MNDDWSIYALPHCTRREQQVFFFGEDAPVLVLAEDEVHVFDALTVGALVSSLRDLHANALAFAITLCERGLAIVCRPRGEARGPHLLVIEPHMDDGVISTGGQLLRRRESHRMTVLTLNRWSDSTKYGRLGQHGFERERVLAIRRAESLLASKFVGFEHSLMDEREFPIGLHETLKGAEPVWPDQALIDAAKRFAPTDAEVDALAERIFARVAAIAPDEIWLPLGVGENPDHVLSSRACLRMLHRERPFFENKRVSLYEDLVAVPRFAGHIERNLATHRRTGKLTRVEEDITAVFADKLRATSIFASQIDMVETPRIFSNMSFWLRETARPADGSDRSVELRYEVVSPPRVPTHGDCALFPSGNLAAKLALAPFVRHRSTIERVLLLSTLSFGKWWIGLEVLKKAFPNAALEIVASEKHHWETSLAHDASVRVRSAPVAEFHAFARSARGDTLVLLVGDFATLGGLDPIQQRHAIVPTFGDAVMALEALLADSG